MLRDLQLEGLEIWGLERYRSESLEVFLAPAFGSLGKMVRALEVAGFRQGTESGRLVVFLL